MMSALIFSCIAALFAQILPVLAADQPTTPSCDDTTRCRTKSDIIRSCVVTVLACTWGAIHPNIPSPDDTWIRKKLRGIGIMIMALIAPELVISWAARQWCVSRQLRKKYKDRNWTQTHGFFALMGGFMCHYPNEPNKPDRTLYPTQHPRLYRRFDNPTLDHIDEVDFPDITEEEIRDKSKGDILSKGLVIIQTGWFVVQCVARGAQDLPITELEIATLAFAVLNFVTYILWWNKPLSVDRPYVIGKRKFEPRQQVESAEEDERPFWVMVKDTANAMVKDTASAIGRAAHVAVKNIKESIGRPHTFTNVPKLFGKYFILPFLRLSAGYKANNKDDWTKSVPTFYSGYVGARGSAWITCLSTFIAIVFGAIHCIAWSFHFPSHIEEMLWRISSLITVSAPLFLFASMGVVPFDMLRGNRRPHLYILVLRVIWLTPILVTSLAYILARLTLLALAFSSLRELPAGAYETVSWTTYIPHV